MSTETLQKAVSCQHPPVGSCGNTTRDPSMLCYHHKMMAASLAHRLGSREEGITSINFRGDPQDQEDEVLEQIDDILPENVNPRGEQEMMMNELQESLTEEELADVKFKADGTADIPQAYFDRRRQEYLEQEVNSSSEGDQGDSEREPVQDDQGQNQDQGQPNPEGGWAGNIPKKGYDPRHATMAAREHALKTFHPSQRKKIKRMMNQWDAAMKDDPELAQKWNNLPREDQLDIIENRLEDQNKVDQYKKKDRRLSNRRYLYESTSKLGRYLDQNSQAAWNMPYRISGGVFGFLGKVTRKIFRI